MSYTWGATSVTPLTAFSDEYAGRFSIAPDGQHVVFERASSVEQSPDLWVMGSDGSDMQLLVEDAGRPDWGIAAPDTDPPPTPVGDERVFLPFLRR